MFLFFFLLVFFFYHVVCKLVVCVGTGQVEVKGCVQKGKIGMSICVGCKMRLKAFSISFFHSVSDTETQKG